MIDPRFQAALEEFAASELAQQAQAKHPGKYLSLGKVEVGGATYWLALLPHGIEAATGQTSLSGMIGRTKPETPPKTAAELFSKIYSDAASAASYLENRCGDSRYWHEMPHMALT